MQLLDIQIIGIIMMLNSKMYTRGCKQIMPKKNFTATSDAVYNQLRQQILYLELPPGASISEIETAEKYDISRTPVRDAFKRLELEHLLEIRPHIGTFISLIDLNAVSDVLYMREVLEYAVLSELANQYDVSLELRVQLLLQEQEELLNSNLPTEELSRSFIINDNEFHDTLFDAAGKKNIRKYLSYMNAQYERFRTLVNFSGKNDLQKLYNGHVTIWNCIKNKDIDALRKHLHHHIYDGFNTSSDVIRKYPDYFKKLK